MKNILLNLIPFTFLLIVCFSCSKTVKNDPSVYEVVTDKIISFPVDNIEKGVPEFCMFDYAFIDGVETLIVPIQYNRLAFYDVSTHKEYHNIPLAQINLDSFKYINKDSIILLYDNSFIDDNLPESGFKITNLQITDYYGNVKVCNYNNDSICLKDNLLPVTHVNSKILYNDGILFLSPLKSTWGTLGTKKFIDDNYPVFMFYDLKSKNLKASKSLKYPYSRKNLFYNTSFDRFHSCFSSEKKPVLRFFYSSELFEWDYENDIVINHSLKSKLLDSIPPLKNENSNQSNLEALYYNIDYDPYNERYYSYLLLFPYPNAMPLNVLILADKNFNYLGEVVNPRIGGCPIYTKDNIITYFCERDSISIYYQRFVKTEKKFDRYIDSVKKLINQEKLKIYSSYEIYLNYDYPIIAYLKFTKKVTEKDLVILTIYENGGCTSCEDKIKKIISQNNEVFAKVPFYLILTGNKQEVIDGSYESFFNLNFIQDTSGVIRQLAYHEDKYTLLNPRLTVLKNNKVVLDTIYDAFHIESDLIPNLLDNLGLREKK